MHLLQSLIFCMLLVGTLGLMSAGGQQIQSQQTVDAIQTQKIEQLTAVTHSSEMMLKDLEKDLREIKSSQDRIVGIGVGLGVALTTLQGLQILLAYKGGKKA